MQSGQIILGMKQPAKLTAFAKMATLLVHFIGVNKGWHVHFQELCLIDKYKERIYNKE